MLSRGCGQCHAVVWSLLNLFFGLILWPALANVPLVLGKCLALLGTSWSTKWRHLAMWSDWLITFSPAYLYSVFLNFHFLKRFIKTSQDGWICWLRFVMLPDIVLCFEALCPCRHLWHCYIVIIIREIYHRLAKSHKIFVWLAFVSSRFLHVSFVSFCFMYVCYKLNFFFNAVWHGVYLAYQGNLHLLLLMVFYFILFF